MQTRSSPGPSGCNQSRMGNFQGPSPTFPLQGDAANMSVARRSRNFDSTAVRRKPQINRTPNCAASRPTSAKLANRLGTCGRANRTLARGDCHFPQSSALLCTPVRTFHCVLERLAGKLVPATGHGSRKSEWQTRARKLFCTEKCLSHGVPAARGS